MLGKTSCPDCGPTPTSHALAWWTSVLDWLFSPYTKLMDKLWRRFRPWVLRLPLDRFAFRLMHWAKALGLGHVVTELKPDHNLRTRVLWEEAKRRGIELFEFRPFGRSVDLMVARFGNELFAFDGLPRPKGWLSDGAEWMDDKAVMREKFSAAQLPIARGDMLVLVKQALEFYDQIGPPLIVKPRVGSRSRHTFTHVATRSQLVRAFYSAQKLCPWVVVEQELQGPVHRATVIGGKLVGVARRDIPQVIGDGAKRIGDLVEIANNHPSRTGEIFHVLPTEPEAREELARQGLTWQSVPNLGQVVTLGAKVNRGIGGVTVDVTGETHADNLALFERVAHVVGDPIIGIDFIVRDVSEPWHTQASCGVIECNSLPFIDLHHYPMVGIPRNAAGAIWDLIWKHEPKASQPKPEPATA